MANQTKNEKTGEWLEIQPDAITPELGAELIRQDEVTQMVYHEELRAGASPLEAMNRATVSYLTNKE
jgi:hypothetical protein